MTDPRTLLGARPDAPSLRSFLGTLTPNELSPEVKSYRDAVYLSYHSIGLSLQFVPTNGYKPSSGLQLGDLKNENLELDSVYIYNAPKTSPGGAASRTTFLGYPITPLVLAIAPDVKDKDGKALDRPSTIDVLPTTSGKEFFQALLEPDRKGGGVGPSTGSIGIWCEWSKDGVMVEFGGDEAKGPKAWEQGKDAVWKVITLFPPPIDMAVPAELTILNISGKFVMNKTLSDSTDEILSLQGVGWLKRKAISIGTVTLSIKHFKDEAGDEHIDIDQTITGGIPGTSENRYLVWQEREHEDHVFGHVIGKSRRVKPEELDIAFLKEGWTPDTLEHGLVQVYSESNTPKSGTTWTANQTWGIETVNGERRYARHVKFTGPKGQEIQARLAYDYLGPL